jgi:hypothetical protein
MRKYASFFQFGDKAVNEFLIAQEFINWFNKNQDQTLHSLVSSIKDPPDCSCLNENNQLIGIELVELVCQQSIELSERSKLVYRSWGQEELIDKIKHLLIDKDSKSYQNGPYSEIIVLIHTDETDLSIEKTTKYLLHSIFGPFNQITQSFLIFSYHPNLKHNPYHVIKIY